MRGSYLIFFVLIFFFASCGSGFSEKNRILSNTYGKYVLDYNHSNIELIRKLGGNLILELKSDGKFVITGSNGQCKKSLSGEWWLEGSAESLNYKFKLSSGNIQTTSALAIYMECMGESGFIYFKR